MTLPRLTAKSRADSARPPIQIVDWGHLAFREAHRRQLEAVEKRIAREIPDTVYLVEHPHVYTYGRAADSAILGSTSKVLGQSVERVMIERGGDVTYHGPGQLVAYPIVDVKSLTGDLHHFLHWMEDIIIQTIGVWGMSGERRSGFTGVWVGEKKIASIGVAVRKWVSYHGLALNVGTDLRYFQAINPCGLPPDVMTSMEAITGIQIPMNDVRRRLAENIAGCVNLNP